MHHLFGCEAIRVGYLQHRLYGKVAWHFISLQIQIDVHRYGAGGSMRACRAAGQCSIPVWDKLPGWGFRVFFSPVRKIWGSFRPRISFGHCNHPYHIRLVVMNEWMVCIVFNARVVSGWPRYCADPSSGEAVHVLVWSKSVYVIQS